MRASLSRTLHGFTALGAALVLMGCGEAAVTYKGTVTEADAPGFTFDDTANPDAKRAIPGVFVTLCVANECTTDLAPRRSDATTSAPDGTWGPLDQIFGGSPFEDTKIEVRFEADGFETFSYTAIYEKTQDWGGQSFLNVHLTRTTPLPRRPAHPSLGSEEGISRSAARQ